MVAVMEVVREHKSYAQNVSTVTDGVLTYPCCHTNVQDAAM
jgi:hypothetical protein